MGQEEEAQKEQIELIKREHPKLKSWYNDTENKAVSELKSKYGNYPTFWQDVIKWEGYKETWKLYWKESDKPSEEPKRKSRWSCNEQTKKSRWSSTNPNKKPTAETGILALLPGIPKGMTESQLKELSELQKRVKFVNERLSNLDAEAARVDSLPRGHRDRSPSPAPIYSADGVRTNTRAVRWREKYTIERQDCLEKIMELNPSLRPPGFIKRKRSKKIYIPVEDHPSYNFIGLIIGPRGKTQKEMENKTNCKIAIRGRGSVKEGARGRRDGKPMEGDDEPLHVVITGDEQANVDQAAALINDMLVVIDDEKNVHKQQQLRELALLNGTLKDEEFCHLCAEKGHRSFECPKRFNTNKKVSVKCAICGDTSHPTRDCARKDVVDETKVDLDYKNFMAELDGTLCLPTETPHTTFPTIPPPAPTTAQQQAAQTAAYNAAVQQQQYAYQQQLYAQQYAHYAHQQAYAQPNENSTEGWDYTSFYNGNNTGAGGFQWWDTQDQS